MSSFLIGPSEGLAMQIMRMQKEAAESAAKKGVKFVRTAAGALPPPPPIKPNNINKNINIIKNIGGKFDFSANNILYKDLGKNLNKII